jgi:O-antigen ligase
MRNISASAMVITVALALFCGVILYGAVDPDVAAPMYALGLLAGVLWAIKLLFTRSVTWKNSPLHWPVLAFIVYALIRYFGSPVEYDARVELLQIGLYALVYFVACQFYRPVDRTIILVTVMSLVVIESLFALLQFSLKIDRVAPFSWIPLDWVRPELYRGRGGGTYICPNNLAGFLELALGLVLARGILLHRAKGSVEAFTVRRLFILYVALMAVVGIAVSLSRGGWGATLAGLLALALWGDWRERRMWIRIGAVGAMVILLGFAAWKLAPARILSTFTGKTGTEIGLRDPTLNIRTHLWTGTLTLIREQPLLGHGIGSWQWLYPKHKHPVVVTHTEYTHNDYLNLASDYGFIGVVLLLCVFAGFFWQAARTSDPRIPSDERSFAVGSVVGVVAVLFHAIFDFNSHIPANALFLAVILGCTAAIEDPDRRFARAPLPNWARLSLGVGVLIVCGILGWSFAHTALGARYTRIGTENHIQVFEPELARARLQKAIAFDPRSAKPYAELADSYRIYAEQRLGPEKKPDRQALARRAVEFFEGSLQLNPFNTIVLLKAARSYELAGDEDRALKTLLRALDNEPEAALVHIKLGQFYRDRGKDDLALKYYEHAERINHAQDPGVQINAIELRGQ